MVVGQFIYYGKNLQEVISVHHKYVIFIGDNNKYNYLIMSVYSRACFHFVTVYLSKGDYNIIAIDWSDLCLPPFYNSAADNAQLVGYYISEMIEFLITNGADISLFHIIGHSLGAHVAGFTGSSFHPKVLPRITGDLVI